MSVIVISRRHWGLPPLRVVVVRRASRVGRTARAMLLAGLTHFAIRQACGISERRLGTILTVGLWSPAESAFFRQAAEADQ